MRGGDDRGGSLLISLVSKGERTRETMREMAWGRYDWLATVVNPMEKKGRMF